MPTSESILARLSGVTPETQAERIACLQIEALAAVVAQIERVASLLAAELDA